MPSFLSILAGALVPGAFPFTPPPLPFHCGACSFNSGEAFIHTLPGESMPASTWAFSLRLDWQEFRAYSDAALLGHGAQGAFTHSLDRGLALRAGVAYAPSDAWTVGLDLPFLANRNLREAVDNGGTPELESNGNPSGLGDASIFAQRSVLADDDAHAFAALYVGAKLPTGRTDVRSPAGERLEPDHQPGSGSLDPFAGLAYAKSFDTTTLAASLLYSFAGDGSQDSNLGDVLRTSVGCGWSSRGSTSAPLVRWMLELNGQWHARMRMDGAVDENSGGVQLFLSPGVRVTWSSHVSWFASLGLPLVQNLDGTQTETSFRASTGVGFSL